MSFWFLGKDAILIGANLTGANLAYADLTSAHLAITELSGAFLAGANLTGVVWSHTICPDGTNSDNNGFTCCGHLNGAVPAACSAADSPPSPPGGSCTSDEFMCDDGQCIPNQYVCEGFPDCADASDESFETCWF